MPKKNLLRYKGSNIYYKNRVELGKKLFEKEKNPTLLATKLLNLYKNNKTSRVIYNESSGEFIMSRLQDKPLLQVPFGIKRLSNKDFMNIQSSKKVNWKVSTNLSSNIPLELTIKYRVQLKYSDEWEPKEGTFMINIAPNKVTDEFVLVYLSEYYGIWSDVDVEFFDEGETWSILSQFTNQNVNIVNQTLRKSNPIKIGNIFNEVLYNNTKLDGKCIQEYLKDIHPRIWTEYQSKTDKSRKQTHIEDKHQKLNNMKTIDDVYNYAIEYSIRMVAYDILGNCVKSHYPKDTKSKRKNISFIAYNNHLYPLKNITLKRIKAQKPKELEFVENAQNSLIELIKDTLPTKITLNSNLTIKSYVNDTKLVINNDDYEDCLTILKKFGLSDQITPFTTLKNISNIIETIYIKDEKLSSFLPNNNRWSKGGYNYTNLLDCDNLSEIDNLVTIDKIKAYSFSLTNLDCLLSTNIATCKSGSYSNSKINKNWLYIVKPHYNYILLPNTNIYTGEHILYCKKEGCKFDILEYLECYSHKNLYKQMVEDLYDKLKDSALGMNWFKTIVNIMIGKFESNRETYYTKKVDKIVNEDEKQNSQGHFVALGNNHYVNFHYEKKHDIENKKPISIQIKDQCRVLIYKMMKKLNIGLEDLIQVKTDSITFLNSKDINYTKYINNNLDGWRVEKNTKLMKPRSPYDTKKSFNYKDLYNTHRLYDCYAGCGKSYHFKKEIDEMIKKYNTYDYIILTPSHATLKEYKLKGYTCNTIQSYSFRQTVPTQQYIYVDEIGMVDGGGWGVLYKAYLMGKILNCAGDFKQLLPPIDGRRFNMTNFIKKVFHNRLNMENNYRNNFTIDYYNSLINSTNTKYLHGEVDKYNTKNYWDADIIICYTNKERAKYNKLMLDRLGFNDINEVGVKIICCCKKGELALKIKGIFNKFTYTIQKVEGNTITIDDDLTITLKQLKNHFELGYARTLYSVQGETINSYYFPKKDYYFLKGCETYTLISRLKQTVDTTSYKPYEIWDIPKRILKHNLNHFLKYRENKELGEKERLMDTSITIFDKSAPIEDYEALNYL
tara:strand:+ start:1033 stop:4218 length:3186 start_codon:yes stop_codon:yes gene_type:complete